MRREMKKFAVCTLGCKVNTYEAQSISETLRNEGYQEVDFNETADIYIIFTCAVTNTASSKSRQKINQAIKQNKEAIITVVGCYVQIKPDELNENENIDILIGSAFKSKLPVYIKQAIESQGKIVKIEDVRNVDVEFENLGVSKFEHQVRAYLKIQDGCNQFCSFCIIPYARGKERSMDFDKVIEMAKALSLNHKEIVLSGIHTGRYGFKHKNLTDVMKAILDSCPNLERLRISSIEVSEVTDELIELMKNDLRVARHLHIPLQSGCDELLKEMHRPYTKSYFKDRIDYIRKHIPEISISTDLIVGFPKESEEQFKETVEFLKDCELSFVHVFPFSSKSGTLAAEYKDDVDAKVKKERVKIINDLSKKLYYAYKAKFIGRSMHVLIERVYDGYAFGHSSEYIPVYVEGKHKRKDSIIVVGSYMKNDELFGSVR